MSSCDAGAPTDVRDVPPTFTVAGDVSVREDAEPHVVSEWASGLDAGSSADFAASAGFVVVTNSNPELFVAPPAVSFPSGDLTFDVAPDANGTADIAVRLENGAESVSVDVAISIEVLPVNDAPSFSGGGVTAAEDGGSFDQPWATSVKAGPPDEAGQSLTFTVTGNTAESLFASPPTIAADGTLAFTPAPDAVGSADISVSLQDGGGTLDGGDDTADPVTFTISITAANDAPSFTAGSVPAVPEDAGPQVVAGWATAIDPGPEESFAGGAAFVVTSNSNPSLFMAAPTVDLASGDLAYTPAANAHGTATVTLELRDGEGGTSAPVDATLTVTAINDVPDLISTAVEVDEDSGEYEAVLVSPGPGEADQKLSVTVGGNDNPALFAAGPAVAADGTLTFSPAPNAFGEAEITFQMEDDGGTAGGGVATATGALAITVQAVNDAPVLTAHLPAGEVGATTNVSSPRSASAAYDLIAPRDATSIVYPGLIDVSSGPSESGQTTTLSAEADSPLADASVAGTGGLTLELPSTAWTSAVVEVRAVDDGGGDDTAVLPLGVLRSEGPAGADQSVTGNEGSSCVPIQLTATFFEDMRDVDGDGNAAGHVVIESLPTGGVLTTDAGDPVVASAPTDELLYCFIPNPRSHSPVTVVDGEEFLDVYTSFDYQVVDDLGDTSEVYTVDIYIDPVF